MYLQIGANSLSLKILETNILCTWWTFKECMKVGEKVYEKVNGESRTPFYRQLKASPRENKRPLTRNPNSCKRFFTCLTHVRNYEKNLLLLANLSLTPINVARAPTSTEIYRFTSIDTWRVTPCSLEERIPSYAWGTSPIKGFTSHHAWGTRLKYYGRRGPFKSRHPLQSSCLKDNVLI